MQGTGVRSLDGEDALEKEVSTPSSVLAWEIPWTEEPGEINPWGCKRVGHNLVTKQQKQNVIFPILEKNCFLLSFFSYWLISLFAFIRKTPWRSCPDTHFLISFPLYHSCHTRISIPPPKFLLHGHYRTIFLNTRSALTLICSVRNFFCSHFFFSFLRYYSGSF